MDLGSATQERKARLAALRQRAQGAGAGAGAGASDAADADAGAGVAAAAAAAGAGAKRARADPDAPGDKPLRFRNYQPEDAQLQEHVEEAAPIGPTAKDRIDTVEGQVEALKKETFEAERRRNKELDLNNLAPKKPNWDLKRDLDKRLEKLDRRTKRVIAELNWERFKSERDIAGAAEHDASTLGRGNDDDDDDE